MRDDIARLSHRGLGIREFSLAAARALRRRVPHDGVCVLTLDPATLLPTGEVLENGLPPEVTPRLTEIELREPDFNKFRQLARASQPAAGLSQATERELSRSTRYRELKQPNGFADELRAVLADDTGGWGAITLLREEGRDHFEAADARFLAELSPLLAEGIRRAVVLTALTADDGHEHEHEAGLVLLGGAGAVESANPAARVLLDELGADLESEAGLPVAVRAVASRARSGAVENGMARARVRTRTGRWLLVRGSVLGEGPAARTAVIIEPARLPELAPLIADAHGLTDRERAVTQRVAQGLSTQEIADALHLSPYTVQDHLKAVFEKMDVSSRGELVARLFFDHYVPRLTEPA